LEAERYADSVQTFSRFIDRGDAPAVVYVNRGDAFFMLEEYEKAIDDYDEAAQMQESGALFFRRATAMIQLGKLAAAEDDISKAIALSPDYADAWRVRGDIAARDFRGENAIEYYSKSLTLDDSDGRVYLGRAVVYRDLNQIDRALADIEEAIELGEDDRAWTFHLRGMCYLDLEKFDRAIADLTTAIKMGETEAQVFILRAEAFRAVGRNEEAAQDEQTAEKMEAKPGHSSLSEGLRKTKAR
jgi:tetratricopeptide (TPR) repeat protein